MRTRKYHRMLMFSRFSPVPRCAKAVAALSAFLFGAGNAVALGLGDLVVHSRLGEALRAEIRLIEQPGADHLGETCFHLGAATGNESLPVLSQGRLRLEQSGGRNRLIISSLQTINEPALLVHVHVGCGAELVRSYTLFTDPGEPDAGRGPAKTPGDPLPFGSSGTPEDAAYPMVWDVVDGESAQSITKALFPRQPRAQRRFLNALRDANPQVDFGEKGEQPLASGVPLVIPDTRRAPLERKTADATTNPQPSAQLKKPDRMHESVKISTDGRMSDRLMISGDAAMAIEVGGLGDTSDLDLRLSSDLSIQLSDKVSENARAMLRVEYRLLNALVFQAEKQLELAEQLRNLEARFEEMRAINDGAAKMANGEPPAEKTSADAMPVKKSIVPVKHPVPEATEWWWPMLLLFVLAGALAGWLVRRQRMRKVADESPTDSSDSVSGEFAATRMRIASEVPTQLDPWDAAEAEAGAAAKSPTFQPDILLDASRPLPFRDDEKARTVPPALAIEVNHVEAADDSLTVLELAEIMVSFGRIKGAAQALSEYLDGNSDGSLLPWLKLLEIYRANDMQAEFAACSTRLRTYFNVAPANWEEAAEQLGEKIEPLSENDLSIEDVLRKLRTVGAFPHVRETIAKTWDTSEGVAYLKRLLRDTRDGQRSGFPLSMAREILFLLDLLETRLRGKG
ncbi:MAG: hypothetical protein QM739_06530 [Propionivibrio sp.]